jgi:hypothetical protein
MNLKLGNAIGGQRHLFGLDNCRAHCQQGYEQEETSSKKFHGGL